MKKLISLIIVIVMLCSCCVFSTSVSAFDEEHMLNNRPEYSITMDFDDDTVMFLLTSRASKSNPEFTPEDFGDLGISEVERISSDGAQNHCFYVTLERHDKQSVLDVIEELHKMDDILVAEPNYRVYSPEDDKLPTAAEEFISFVVEQNNGKISQDDVWIEYMYTFSQDKYLVRYHGVMDYNQVEVQKLIGDYKLSLPCPPIPEVYYNGEIYDLFDAYETGILNDGDLETMTKFRKVDFVKLLFGDADNDNELSILDATLIQQFIARLVQANALEAKLADFDRDGEITVLDATAIQLKLAGLQ